MGRLSASVRAGVAALGATMLLAAGCTPTSPPPDPVSASIRGSMLFEEANETNSFWQPALPFLRACVSLVSAIDGTLEATDEVVPRDGLLSFRFDGVEPGSYKIAVRAEWSDAPGSGWPTCQGDVVVAAGGAGEYSAPSARQQWLFSDSGFAGATVYDLAAGDTKVVLGDTMAAEYFSSIPTGFPNPALFPNPGAQPTRLRVFNAGELYDFDGDEVICALEIGGQVQTLTLRQPFASGTLTGDPDSVLICSSDWGPAHVEFLDIPANRSVEVDFQIDAINGVNESLSVTFSPFYP